MVERFYCVGPEGSQMVTDPIGGYVRYGDYDALAARLAEAERLLANAHYQPDCADMDANEWWTAYWTFFDRTADREIGVTS